MTTATRPTARHDLLADGSLGLEIEVGLEPLVRRWLPRGLPAPAPAPTAGPVIHVRRHRPGKAEGAGPDGHPTLRLGSVGGWTTRRGSKVELRGSAATRGVIHLDGRRAELRAGDDGDAVARDLYSMLTLSAGLLLGAAGRALVHAGAVVGPGGHAWILAGDARSGKTTTVTSLIRHGWDYLSDDQVIVQRPGRNRPPRVEGWLRPFHLDERWSAGEPGGPRKAVDPLTLGPGRRLGDAPAAGLLFPTVRPAQPTRLTRVKGAEALTLLLRQSPWLLALPPRQAERALRLLRDLCRLPCHRLRLGRDSFRNGAGLAELLARPPRG